MDHRRGGATALSAPPLSPARPSQMPPRQAKAPLSREPHPTHAAPRMTVRNEAGNRPSLRLARVTALANAARQRDRRLVAGSGVCKVAGLGRGLRHARPTAAGRDYHEAAVQLPRTGHSGLPQRFLQANVADADFAVIRCGCAKAARTRSISDVEGGWSFAAMLSNDSFRHRSWTCFLVSSEL